MLSYMEELINTTFYVCKNIFVCKLGVTELYGLDQKMKDLQKRKDHWFCIVKRQQQIPIIRGTSYSITWFRPKVEKKKYFFVGKIVGIDLDEHMTIESAAAIYQETLLMSYQRAEKPYTRRQQTEEIREGKRKGIKLVT